MRPSDGRHDVTQENRSMSGMALGQGLRGPADPGASPEGPLLAQAQHSHLEYVDTGSLFT